MCQKRFENDVKHNEISSVSPTFAAALGVGESGLCIPNKHIDIKYLVY